MPVREVSFWICRESGTPRESLDVEAGAQSLESMGMVGLDMELFDQLAADGLNDLAQRVKEAAERPGELSFLVTSGLCLRRGKVCRRMRLCCQSSAATARWQTASTPAVFQKRSKSGQHQTRLDQRDLSRILRFSVSPARWSGQQE